MQKKIEKIYTCPCKKKSTFFETFNYHLIAFQNKGRVWLLALTSARPGREEIRSFGWLDRTKKLARMKLKAPLNLHAGECLI